MHICRQICIFYARICTLGAVVSFAYMHVHIVTALADFFSRGTERHGFGIPTWKHVGTQKISTQCSKLVVSCRSLYTSPEVGDA